MMPATISDAFIEATRACMRGGKTEARKFVVDDVVGDVAVKRLTEEQDGARFAIGQRLRISVRVNLSPAFTEQIADEWIAKNIDVVELPFRSGLIDSSRYVAGFDIGTPNERHEPLMTKNGKRLILFAVSFWRR